MSGYYPTFPRCHDGVTVNPLVHISHPPHQLDAQQTWVLDPRRAVVHQLDDRMAFILTQLASGAARSHIDHAYQGRFGEELTTVVWEDALATLRAAHLIVSAPADRTDLV